MSQEHPDALDQLLAVVEDEEDLTREEFEAVVDELETGKKYTVSTYNMFCTSENIVVICDTETEEFYQVEVPMDEGEEIVVTRDQ